MSVNQLIRAIVQSHRVYLNTYLLTISYLLIIGYCSLGDGRTAGVGIKLIG